LERAVQAHRTGRLPEAERGYGEVLAIDPEEPDALHLLGILVGSAGDHARARALIERSLRHKPTAQAYVHLGHAQLGEGRVEEAIASFEAAIRREPNHAEAHHHLGNALSRMGRRAEAIAAYHRALAAKPDLTEAYSNLGLVARWQKEDPLAKDLLALAQRADAVPVASRIHLFYALGKYYDDVDEPDLAFAFWQKGAALKRASLRYDPAVNDRTIASIIKSFPPGDWASRRDQGDPSEVPVFVLGMPRSGTSLVEQILASHARVHGAGEIGLLGTALQGFHVHPDLLSSSGLETGSFADELRRRGADYVRQLRALAPNAARITDKRPSNFLLVGAIHLTLPGARIVFCKRDLRDVCLSCYQTLFMEGHAWSYDLTELGRYAAGFAELMEHWNRALPGRILELEYEKLVTDPEGQARRLLEHCGLDWDARCLDFYRTQRAVQTASLGQVRQPIYSSSIDRWRRFERHLGPLFEALGDAPASLVKPGPNC
jgi:tetratricopeptide (TPR) repeat protein